MSGADAQRTVVPNDWRRMKMRRGGRRDSVMTRLVGGRRGARFEGTCQLRLDAGRFRFQPTRSAGPPTKSDARHRQRRTSTRRRRPSKRDARGHGEAFLSCRRSWGPHGRPSRRA